MVAASLYKGGEGVGDGGLQSGWCRELAHVVVWWYSTFYLDVLNEWGRKDLWCRVASASRALVWGSSSARSV